MEKDEVKKEMKDNEREWKMVIKRNEMKQWYDRKLNEMKERKWRGKGKEWQGSEKERKWKRKKIKQKGKEKERSGRGWSRWRWKK